VNSLQRFYSFIHSFIHSFILNIYIAPLQENYSEALPTPARLNKQSSLKMRKKRRWRGSIKKCEVNWELIGICFL